MIRVLIVDDSPTVRLTLQTILESDPQIKIVGYASNGREALDRAMQLRPDLITMDVLMPEMDGIQVLEVLADYKVKAAIVLMSGADTSLSKAEAFAKRADLRLIGVLHKPFRLADVQNIFAAD